MVDFPAYSDDEMLQLARDYLAFHAGLVGVDLDLGDGSDADMTARLLAALLSMSQRQATAVMTAASPIKAFGAFLRDHATCYGIGPDFASVGVGPVAATGYAIVRCSVGSTLVPSGLALTAPDGQQYVTTLSATAPAAAGGVVLPGPRSMTSLRRFTVGTGNGTVSTTFTPPVYSVLQTAGGELCAVSESVGVSSGSQQERFELFHDLASLPGQFSRALAVCVPITAVTPGRAGNRDPNGALTVQSPPSGVLASAVVVRCEGGRDAMTPAEIRTQLRDLFATRHVQGKPSEIRDLAIATPYAGIEDAHVLPGYFGVGSYYVQVLSRFGRTVSPARTTQVESYIQARAPRGIFVRASSCIELASYTTVIDVDCAAGYGPDFFVAGATGAMPAAIGLVVAGTSTTNVVISGITDATNLPRVGDRVIVTTGPFAGTADVQQRAWVVQAKVLSATPVSSGSSTIVVDAVINDYAAPAIVTAGGPLGQTVIDAIYSSYDTRSPSAPTTPIVVYPELDAATNRGALVRAIAAVPGVVDVQVSPDDAYIMTGNEVWQLGPTVIRLHAS